MADTQLSTFLRRLRRVLRPREAESASDAQLLERFVQQRDEQAFELLVWRHGLMVLNVCRRVLRHEHTAEDAFQATFLALARKADVIGKRASVGSWLYKVAYRVALRARSTLPIPSLPDEPLPDAAGAEPIDDLLWRELTSAMDEEIQRLPEKYRTALVLCHLEGLTIESAARMLACPPGTIGTRLVRGRALLRRRLERRGFDGSSVGGTRSILAVLSAALVHSTVQAAQLGTVEQAAATGVISASVAALTKGALQAMSLTRWTAITVMVLTLSLAGGGGALLAHRVLATQPAKATSAPHPRSSSAAEKKPAAVSFQWKFKKGQPFYQVVSTKTVQRMTVTNNDVNQSQSMIYYLQWTPVKEQNGRWILAQKIIGVKMDIDIGGAPIIIDSTVADNTSTSTPLHEFCEALVGTEFKLTLDADTLQILRVEGHKEFVDKFKKIQPIVDKILSENVIKEMSEQSFAALLMGPARPGDRWVKTSELDMGPIGKYRNTFQCNYKGREDKLDKIQIKITSKHHSPAGKQGVGEIPFRIHKANLRGKGTGTLYFDGAKGRLAHSESTLKLQGTMTIEIGGQNADAILSQTQQTTVQTMDANPIEAKRLREEKQRLQQEIERLRQRLHAVEDALRGEDESKK